MEVYGEDLKTENLVEQRSVIGQRELRSGGVAQEITHFGDTEKDSQILVKVRR